MHHTDARQPEPLRPRRRSDTNWMDHRIGARIHVGVGAERSLTSVSVHARCDLESFDACRYFTAGYLQHLFRAPLSGHRRERARSSRRHDRPAWRRCVHGVARDHPRRLLARRHHQRLGADPDRGRHQGDLFAMGRLQRHRRARAVPEYLGRRRPCPDRYECQLGIVAAEFLVHARARCPVHRGSGRAHADFAVRRHFGDCANLHMDCDRGDVLPARDRQRLERGLPPDL